MSSEARATPSPTVIAAAILLLLLSVMAALAAPPTAATSPPVTPGAALIDPAASDPIAALIATVTTVERPLAPCLGGAVVAYDIGLDPRQELAVVSDIMWRAAPHLSRAVATWIEDFHRWSGLSPAADVLPHLERDVTLAVLAAHEHDRMWPLPRPVIVLRISDPAPVARFAAQWTRWKAAAIAPLTGGLVGAAAVTGELGGRPFFGLDIDALASLPMPAPTVVVLDRLLVMSPSRTAAAEVAACLSSTCPRRAGDF